MPWAGTSSGQLRWTPAAKAAEWQVARLPGCQTSWAEEEERRGGTQATSPVGRGPGTSPRRAFSRAPSRHGASWTDRRSYTPTRSSFPPAKKANPTATRWSGHGDGVRWVVCSSLRCPPILLPLRRCAPERGRADNSGTTPKKGTSPAQRWIDAPRTTAVIVEIDENPTTTPVMTSYPRVPDDEDLWNACEEEP